MPCVTLYSGVTPKPTSGDERETPISLNSEKAGEHRIGPNKVTQDAKQETREEEGSGEEER